MNEGYTLFVAIMAVAIGVCVGLAVGPALGCAAALYTFITTPIKYG